MPPVKVIAITRIKPVHSIAEIGLKCPKKKMVMIAHQTESKNLKMVVLTDALEKL